MNCASAIRSIRQRLRTAVVVLSAALAWWGAALLGAVPSGTPLDGIFTLMVCPASSGRPRNSEGDIARLKDGSLLLAYGEFIGRDGSDFGSGRIAAKVSHDEGHSWSHPYVLMPNTGKMNVTSPTLLRLKSGKLGIVYIVKDSLSDSHMCFRISSDETKTWSEPVRINAEEGYWGTKNSCAVQLESGRILVPMWFVHDWNQSHHTRSTVGYSDDEGRTWKTGDVVDIPQGSRGADEPVVVELEPGHVMMLIRSNIGHIFRSDSMDGGVHWTPAEQTALDSPTAPSTIVRMPKRGDLLLVWNNHKPGTAHMEDRFPLSTAVSSDEGRTWSHMRTLDNAHGFTYSYASVTFTKPDTAIVTYYARQDTAVASATAPLPGETRGQPSLSLKEKIVPVSWFYGPHH